VTGRRRVVRAEKKRRVLSGYPRKPDKWGGQEGRNQFVPVKKRNKQTIILEDGMGEKPGLLHLHGKQGKFPGDGAAKAGLKEAGGLEGKDGAMETVNASHCDGNGAEEGKVRGNVRAGRAGRGKLVPDEEAEAVYFEFQGFHEAHARRLDHGPGELAGIDAEFEGVPVAARSAMTQAVLVAARSTVTQGILVALWSTGTAPRKHAGLRREAGGGGDGQHISSGLL
jgi:hypothetical protein